MLYQIDDTKKYRPVAFYSRKLKVSEKKYARGEKELMAIVFAMDHYNIYLYGKEFIVRDLKVDERSQKPIYQASEMVGHPETVQLNTRSSPEQNINSCRTVRGIKRREFREIKSMDCSRV